MSELRIWVGKEGFFRAESEKVFSLLSNFDFKTNSISIYPSPNAQTNWALDSNYNYYDASEPGTVKIFTSGTTGNAKAVTKYWDDIFNSKAGKGQNTDTWLYCYSPSRWAGLSVFTHCIRNKSKLVIPPSLSPLDIVSSLSRCTHISITPSMFKKILISAEIPPNEKVKQVTFGGEYAYQSILDAAKMHFPNARISHIYAAAEFGDLVCESSGIEGYPRLPGEITAEGELFIDGKSTGDLWDLVEKRYVYRGRKGTMLNIGGIKINPGDIEELICAVPGVDECYVYGEPSPFIGTILCADYIGTIDELTLTKLLRSTLPKVSVPKMHRVSDISLSKAGKKIRT